jgi:hypothetical protein
LIPMRGNRDTILAHNEKRSPLRIIDLYTALLCDPATRSKQK